VTQAAEVVLPRLRIPEFSDRRTTVGSPSLHPWFFSRLLQNRQLVYGAAGSETICERLFQRPRVSRSVLEIFRCTKARTWDLVHQEESLRAKNYYL